MICIYAEDSEILANTTRWLTISMKIGILRILMKPLYDICSFYFFLDNVCFQTTVQKSLAKDCFLRYPGSLDASRYVTLFTKTGFRLIIKWIYENTFLQNDIPFVFKIKCKTVSALPAMDNKSSIKEHSFVQLFFLNWLFVYMVLWYNKDCTTSPNIRFAQRMDLSGLYVHVIQRF